MKPHILILEDEAILYHRLQKSLSKEGFTVSQYAKSYQEGIAEIKNKLPDLALLDIELKGEKTGIDFGNLLKDKYGIPFIYLSKHQDRVTFERSLLSEHEQFIIKSKPKLDINQVLVTIKTVLHRKGKESQLITKNGLLGLKNYLSELRRQDNLSLSKVPIHFDDIALLSVGQYENRKGKIIHIKRNYLVISTLQDEFYFMNKPLVEIEGQLPHFFVRISGHTIVNIKPSAFDGRINGSRLQIAGKRVKVTDRYRAKLERKIEKYYYK